MWLRFLLAGAVLLLPGGSLILVAAAVFRGIRDRRAAAPTLPAST